MKKIAMICVSALTAAALITGCSGGDASQGTVTLGQYKGLTVNVPAPEVTDEEVETRIQTILSQNPVETEVDRAAQEGDIVNIDFKGTQDGVEFEGGSGENQDLTLGSGKMIDGFEDGIIGMKKGETKDLDLTFPEDYDVEALAGQAVVFEVTVNSVKEQSDAELNEEFVQRVSEYTTVAEYRDSIRAELLANKQKNADLTIQQDVVQQVIDGSEFKFSRNGLSKSYNTRIDQYKAQAKMYNMSLSQFAQAQGMDEPSFKEMVYAQVKEDAKTQLVLDAVAAQEGITLEDGDMDSFAAINGQTAEDVVNIYGQEMADEMALNYKVMKFLADNAVNAAEEGAAAATASEAEPAEE